MRIYVASSWRNEHFDGVVAALRADGHLVYDFKAKGDGWGNGQQATAFAWEQLDANWRDWTPGEFIMALNTSIAETGFQRDMQALRDADACVMVHPCGSSAALEAGWACGADKLLIVYLPGLREAELMLKMAHTVTDNLDTVRLILKEYAWY